MGLFNVFKKSKGEEQEKKTVQEYRPLQARVMFVNEPVLDQDILRKELMQEFDTIQTKEIKDKHFSYTFPDKVIEHENKELEAQIQIFLPKEPNFIGVHPQIIEQSWYFKDAHAYLADCKYELLITDFPYEGRDYETRLEVFNNFLLAFTKAMKPRVVFSISGQKLLSPQHIMTCLNKEVNFNPLFTCINLRQYHIKETPEDEDAELLLDTIGLNSFGLPDLQIKSYGLDSNKVSTMLWSYSLRSILEGDFIQDGDTVGGADEDSHWTCQRTQSLVPPKRDIVNLVQS